MDEDDDFDDLEAPDSSDLSDDDESVDTLQCPACGDEVYEGTGACTRCGTHIEYVGRRVSPRNLAIVLAVIIAVVTILFFGR